MVHQFQGCLFSGRATFWVRARLQDKFTGYYAFFQSRGTACVRAASKLYGSANFLELVVCGRVGCGGLSASKQRQYEFDSLITPSIALCFDVLFAIVACQFVNLISGQLNVIALLWRLGDLGFWWFLDCLVSEWPLIAGRFCCPNPWVTIWFMDIR